jgi:acetyltransferase-like isoleucine patch superfamily enzyme
VPLIRRLILFKRRSAMGIASRWRNVWLKLLGVRVNGYCWLRAIEVPRDHHNIELNGCSLDRGVILLCGGPAGAKIKLSIGEGTYVNRGCFFDATESLTVGRRSAFGPGCYVTDHDHGTDPAKAPLAQEMVSIPTHIGDEVWIGAHVTILKGVTIGDKTIVGAGSVVTKSLPPGVIAAGVPARVIRLRSDVPA